MQKKYQQPKLAVLAEQVRESVERRLTNLRHRRENVGGQGVRISPAGVGEAGESHVHGFDSWCHRYTMDVSGESFAELKKTKFNSNLFPKKSRRVVHEHQKVFPDDDEVFIRIDESALCCNTVLD
ncbi:hypothetical protein F2P81_022652 [Scophthalmus maximus]|uniref:Uncharacterized protein n=1 Tax=Scophthalmus maximus TaxID=52904 RepID=A0A6A4S3L5_SCOMX|nr:hypothetical protein F2P81_022652 [Scophthalmus maximus]